MAANQSSPGVVFQERDLTTITTLSTANVGLIAAPFTKGPVNEIVQISSERELAEVFGKPNDSNYEYWYTAAQYLSYGGVLKTIRVASTTLKNSVADRTGAVDSVLIKNLDEYESTFEGSGSNTFNWAARNPGTLGNSIRVFTTDAGADQIATCAAPASGGEWRFVAEQPLTAGASTGLVYKYSIVLTVESIVGTFTVGETANISISGADKETDVIAWDPANKKLEVGIPSGGVDAIIADGQTITGATSTATADIAASGVQRNLYISLNKGSAEFSATDSVLEGATGAGNSVTLSTVSDEYSTREYLPGLKWINVAPRPGTSRFAENAGGSRDELHILVLDADGKITGTTNAVLERFIGVSKASDAKTTVGETNYYPTVVKQRSEYIFWGFHEEGLHDVDSNVSGTWGAVGSTDFDIIRNATGTKNYPTDAITLNTSNNSTAYYAFSAGVDYAGSGSYTVTNADFAAAYELGEDPESQVIDFILTGPSGASDSDAIAKITSLVNIAEERRDCLVFVSPRRANVVGVTNNTTATNNVIDFFDQLPSSSYVVFDSGYKYIYDKYNDVYRYVPTNGDVAGLCLQTTEVSEPWFSPAGFQRGILRNAIKLAYTPNKGQRDRLYAARVNPIVSFPGQGVVLYGDKTALGFASAFDRINVRRLFLTIERVISGAAKSQLFEQNDESQRSLFLNIVEPYLRDVQGRRGVTDFLVKCDSDNNPPEAVDRGEFYAEIFVKPTRTINYITLTFVATRTGVAFNEVAS